MERSSWGKNSKKVKLAPFYCRAFLDPAVKHLKDATDGDAIRVRSWLEHVQLGRRKSLLLFLDFEIHKAGFPTHLDELAEASNGERGAGRQH